MYLHCNYKENIAKYMPKDIRGLKHYTIKFKLNTNYSGN